MSKNQGPGTIPPPTGTTTPSTSMPPPPNAPQTGTGEIQFGALANASPRDALIPASSTSLSESVAKAASSSTPSSSGKSMKSFLGATEYNPSQTQGQTPTSSQPSSSRNIQAFVNTIEYRPTNPQTSAPDYSSSVEATSSAPSADTLVTEEWNPQTIAQKIPTLVHNAQSITILNQICDVINQDATYGKFYFTGDINNIVKALIDLKNALVTNHVLAVLKPHIAERCDTFPIEMIRSIFGCLTSLNYIDTWKISLTFLPRMAALIGFRGVNKNNVLNLVHISGSLQGLMSIAHLGDAKLPEIENLVTELLRHLKYHQSDKKYLNKASIVLTASALNGIPNPTDSAIDKLLDYLASRIKIEANSLTFKEIAYILRGLEGKQSSKAVKEILDTISKILFAELAEISGINITLAIGGLRTLANLAEAQKLLPPLLQLSQTNQVTAKGNILTLLYSLASYRGYPEILSLANDKNTPLVTSELMSMFQDGLAALDDILPYLAGLRTSKPGSNYVPGHGYINPIQLDLHDSEHSLARALCLYTLESVFLTDQTYTELTIIVGKAAGEERNTGIMLAIADSTLALFSDSINWTLVDSNQGRLSISRQSESSASSSSAPAGEKA